MKEFILQECTPEQRAEQLERLAASKEVLRYSRNLTEAEIDTESKHMAKLYKDLCGVEAEKSAANKEFGEQIKSIRAQIEVSANTLQNGQKEVSETCYKFIDIDAREVGFYDKYGQLVRRRAAQDTDLQLDMFGNTNVEEQKQAVAALPGEAPIQQGDPNAEVEEAEVVEESNDPSAETEQQGGSDVDDEEDETHNIFN